MILGPREGVGLNVELSLDVGSVKTRGVDGVEVESEVREEIDKVDKLGFARSRRVCHPAQGRCVVCGHSEDEAINIGNVGMLGLVHVAEDQHEEEDIDKDADELVDVDMVLWSRWVWGLPGGEGPENGVGGAPLEREFKGVSSHGEVGGVGEP